VRLNFLLRSAALSAIASHAQEYVKAIEFSVIATQNGYNIATEALHLTEMSSDMSDIQTLTAGKQRYLELMDRAREGQNGAKQALQRFRDVRVVLGRVRSFHLC